jgi:hypothetical protein
MPSINLSRKREPAMVFEDSSVSLLTSMILLAGGVIFAALAILAASVQAYSDRHPRDASPTKPRQAATSWRS